MLNWYFLGDCVDFFDVLDFYVFLECYIEYKDKVGIGVEYFLVMMIDYGI